MCGTMKTNKDVDMNISDTSENNIILAITSNSWVFFDFMHTFTVRPNSFTLTMEIPHFLFLLP